MGERPLGFVPDGFVPDSAPIKPASSSGFVDAAKNFVTNFAHTVDPRPALKLLYDTANGLGGVFTGDPSKGEAFKEDVKGLANSQLEQFKKAQQAYHDGRLSEAVGHTIAGALPLVGPAAANAGEQIGSGDVSGGLGTAAGLLAPSALHAAPGAIRARIPTAPVEESVRFGQSRGIPIDAATATDSDIVRSVQKRVTDSMGGAGVAEKFKRGQADALARVGGELADQVSPTPATAEQAGTATRAAVDARVTDLGTQADAAYGKLRAIEAQRPVPVDFAPVKTVLEPIYATMAKGADIAPLQGSKATAVRAMARILEGPDIADASVADSALSDLKALQRDAQGTPGAGAINAAVSQVHAAVMKAVSKAGPDAVAALTEGRRATIAKYAAQDVLDSLNQEPVRTTQALTAPKDSAIASLRAVAQQAPQAMPQIARSVLDGMLDRATGDGGFDHARAIRAQWQKLGPETKALLFQDPAYVRDLDNFFRLADKIAENPNPSGTARVNNLFNATSTAVGYPIAKLLYSPAGVKLLTQGLTVPLQSPTMVASYTTRLAAALRASAAMEPAMASGSPEETPPTIGRR